MEHLVGSLIDLFEGLNKELIVFIISMLPLLESRGGLLAAMLLQLDFIPGFIISFLGNALPIPLVLLFIEKIFNWLKKYNKTNKIITKFEKKTLSKKGQIEKYGYLGLILFVGIPLPGTVLLELDKKKSFIYIMLGIVLASIIMSILSYGILDKIIR